MFKPFAIEPIQKLFYLAWKSWPYSAEHSHLLAYRLSSKPNIESLKQAIYAFVNRYPLSLSVVDPKTEQFVYKAFSLSDYFFINTSDCRQASSEIEAIRHQPFDCENQPFIRFYLFKAQGEWHFVFSAHHICCDARSASILIDELAMLYAKQAAPEVMAHQNAYFDALSLCEQLRKQQELSSRQYWFNAFRPLKNQRAGTQQISTAQEESHQYKDCVFESRVLTPIYKTYHTTGFGFFSAAIGALLAQYTQMQNCIIQTPVDIRPHQFFHAIGCFVNVVPLFVKLSNKKNFTDLVNSLNQQRKQAKSYLRFPSQQIDQLNPWNHCVQFGMASTIIKSSEFQFGQIRAMPLDHRFSVSHHYDFFALLEITSSETRLRIEAKPGFMQVHQLAIFCNSLEIWIHQMTHCNEDSMPLWLDSTIKYHVNPKPCVLNNPLNTSKDLSVFEKKLSVLWQQIAVNPELSINDDLTMVGIDSIKAISLIAKINDTFNQTFTVADLYQHQSIRQFAVFLSQFSASTDIKLLSQVRSKSDHLPRWYFVHPGKGGVSVYQPIANALSRDYQIIGIENHNLFNQNKIKGLSKLSNNYLNQIDTSGYPLNNEITLCGWSLGGLISLEMAAQLEVLGLHKIKVALFDTYVMDCSLQALRKKIDEDQYKKLYQQSLDTLNIDPQFYKALLQNLDWEIKLETESPSRKLTRTKVTLFKAEQIDQSLHDPYLIKYNQHIVDLPLNNVDEYVEKQNIQRVRLACHHGQILSMLSFLAGFNILQAYMNHDVKY